MKVMTKILSEMIYTLVTNACTHPENGDHVLQRDKLNHIRLLRSERSRIGLETGDLNLTDVSLPKCSPESPALHRLSGGGLPKYICSLGLLFELES